MNTEVMFSSKSDEWETPQTFFDELNKEFNFDIDVCATEENHKCEKYFTKQNDGLSQKWGGTMCGAIHHIARLISGLQRLFTKHEMIIQQLYC